MEPIEVVERLGRWSSGPGPLYVLLAQRLRELIDAGELPPGTLLPPDRVFAALLSVGRGTVVATYDLLRAEGRVTRRRGSGTRVAGEPVADRHQDTSAPMFLHLLEPRRDAIMLACAAPESPPEELAAAYGAIAPALTDEANIGYWPAGHPVLRRAVADRYTRRGAPTAPEQILVTNGGQHGLSVLARALLRPGDRVLAETPTYPGALEAFREQGAVVRPMRAGLDGFEGAVGVHRPVAAYVIPTFQNPTGGVLSVADRRRLVAVARRSGVTLIDDEVLAELGFPGEELPPPLAAWSDDVVTVGSFSKTVWGGFRVGWVRAPADVVARLARLRAVHDLGGNVPAQLAAAELLPRLEGILRRTAIDRRRSHDVLVAALRRRLPDWQTSPVRGGQTLWVRLPHGDGVSFAQVALRHGVVVLPGSGLDPSGASDAHIRLHFLHAPSVLTDAVGRLARAWGAYRPPSTPARGLPALSI